MCSIENNQITRDHHDNGAPSVLPCVAVEMLQLLVLIDGLHSFAFTSSLGCDVPTDGKVA